MAILLKRLQKQSFCTHQLQQRLLFHEYKKPKLPLGPLQQEALQIQFSNRLLSG